MPNNKKTNSNRLEPYCHGSACLCYWAFEKSCTVYNTNRQPFIIISDDWQFTQCTFVIFFSRTFDAARGLDYYSVFYRYAAPNGALIC